MKIYIANPTGLCFGVKRAITTLEEELKKTDKVYSLGSPIHNEQEIKRLNKLGLIVVNDPLDIPHGAVSFIRAHGVTPKIYSTIKDRSSFLVDGTCPFVKTAQERAETLSKEGYIVVILGDADHPEVKAIVGYVEGLAVVVSDSNNIPKYLIGKKCGILSQTTQRVSSFASLVTAFIPISPEIKVYNTICKATLERQESVSHLASKVDGMLILGGRDSANTRKLVEITEDAGVSTKWIEHARELDEEWLLKKKSIGIATGNNTPN